MVDVLRKELREKTIGDRLALLASFCALFSRDPPTGRDRAGRYINKRTTTFSEKMPHRNRNRSI